MIFTKIMFFEEIKQTLTYFAMVTGLFYVGLDVMAILGFASLQILLSLISIVLLQIM